MSSIDAKTIKRITVSPQRASYNINIPHGKPPVFEDYHWLGVLTVRVSDVNDIENRGFIRNKIGFYYSYGLVFYKIMSQGYYGTIRTDFSSFEKMCSIRDDRECYITD